MGASWIPAAIGLGGELLGDFMSSKGQAQTNAANAQMAREQMQFQERMSSTAVQRQVEDYKKAGLNPALAYNAGGSSTPGGAMATQQNALASFKGSAQGAAQTYSQLASTKASIEQQHAQTEQTKAQTTQLLLESQARLQELQARSALIGTNAKFAAEAYKPNMQNLWQRNVLADTDIKRQNMELQFRDATIDREKAIMWPLAQQAIEWQIKNAMVNARDTAAGARLKELQAPMASNMAEMAKTKWGKYAVPYMSSAKDAFSLTSALAKSLLP